MNSRLIKRWFHLSHAAKLLVAFVLMLGQQNVATAQLNIEVTRGGSAAIPVAVVPFSTDFSANQDTDIASIIANNFRRSGQINPITNVPSRPNQPENVDTAAFRNAGANFVLVGSATLAGSNYVSEFALVDTSQGSVLLQNRITVPNNQPRKLAHTISDLVFERLTGNKGSFGTRLAYVQQQGNAYALVVSDADGYNPNVVLNSNEPIVSPTWSPDGRRLAYVSYETGRAAIYVQDVFNGQRQQITNFDGVNSSPAWSPDGNRIAVTLSPNGNSEIYIYDLNASTISRVTRHEAIDTGPAWSPDGSTLFFISDRSGSPAVYRTSPNGGSVNLVANNAQSVDVSPRGNKIAYTSGSGSNFRLVVADIGGGNAQAIGSGPRDDTPSFSPDGSMLVYAVRQGNQGYLVVASADGSMQQQLSAANGVIKDPAWSPQ